MLRKIILLLLLAVLAHNVSKAQNFGATDIEIILPNVIVSDLKQPITLKIISDSLKGKMEGATKSIMINGISFHAVFKMNEAIVMYSFNEKEILKLEADNFKWEKPVHPIPLWMSILPPLVAILMALILREVFVALFIGVLVGTSIMFYFKGYGIFMAIGKGMLAIVDTYVMESLLDKGHMSIIIFSLVIGGMVQLITNNGGMTGVVNRLSKYATSALSGQLITFLLGVVIFFDDYANTLVVGNTMRPVTDRLKISREKLAYIVDSTAAPVAAIAFVTTWIGAQLSYIQAGLNTIGLEQSAYSVFLNSLAFSFYPFLALIFILVLALMKRDFGPMLTAERKARSVGVLTEESALPLNSNSVKHFSHAKKARAFNAIIPVAVIVFGTLAGLLFTGWDLAVWQNSDLSFGTKISIIIGKSNSYLALLWSSISALVIALVLTLSQKLLRLNEAIESIVNGFRTMLTAILILTLAWSVALVTDHMHTADFISAALLKMAFSPYLIPAFTFILAGLVAFSTGSSWGTMAILYPLILPTSWLLTTQHGLDHEHSLIIFYSVVSAVLSGSIFGDHCSPISDTTILSSISSGCNHINHVRTQLPYAIIIGMVSIFVGIIPAAFGIAPWLLLLIAVMVISLIIRFVGKRTDNPIH